MDQAKHNTETPKDETTSISRKSGGKLLSRNELYSPLVAYEQTRVAPSSYMMTQPSIPKPLRESSLISFLQKVSNDFHRYNSNAGDPKNNGSRPTSHGDVESKIKQRAVTLIGAGVASSLTSDITAPEKRRKRKRRSWSDVEVTLRKQSQECDTLPQRLDSPQFLQQLNTKWNEYISSALMLTEATSEASSVASTFASQRAHLELIGAHVRIATCSQRRRMEGRYGVLVGETENAWQIAALQSKSETLAKETAGSDEPILKRTVDTLLLPKRGSCLILIIPTSTSPNDPITNPDSENFYDLISHSKRSICITVDPAEQHP